MDTIKPQLDHSDPSYQAALARCQRAEVGEAAPAVTHPFGTPLETTGRAPVLPDPPGAQRRAPGATPRRRPKPAPHRTRAFALLAALGRPATADELAPGDKQVRAALKNAADWGMVEVRVISLTDAPPRRGGMLRMAFALPGMEWPEQFPGARYVDRRNTAG